MRIHNLYTDANGESHFRDIEVEWIEQRRGSKLSKRLPATGVNTTSSLTTLLEGRPLVGEPATDTLAVLALPAAVPTLEWWGLLLLFGLFGLAAWWGLQRGHVPPPASA